MNQELIQQKYLELLQGMTKLYPEDKLISSFYGLMKNHANDINFDFLSANQINSKKWLVSELKKLDLELGMIYLVAGWYGLHARLIDQAKLNYTKIRLFDQDPLTVKIADRLNHDLLVNDWKFKGCCKDIFDIDYLFHEYTITNSSGKDVRLMEQPSTIINTSCEHIEYGYWLRLIPRETLLVLQSNNATHLPEHKFCVENLEEFIAKTRLKKIYFSGTLQCDGYDRFMIIGRN